MFLWALCLHIICWRTEAKLTEPSADGPSGEHRQVGAVSGEPNSRSEITHGGTNSTLYEENMNQATVEQTQFFFFL